VYAKLFAEAQSSEDFPQTHKKKWPKIPDPKVGSTRYQRAEKKGSKEPEKMDPDKRKQREDGKASRRIKLLGKAGLQLLLIVSMFDRFCV